MTGASTFETALDRRARQVGLILDEVLGPRPLTGEVDRPARLMAAMRHGALNGGKRLRPFLVIECAALFDAHDDAILRVAAALECVHCYSLVHDDLPAMDDDDMRRGMPTVHRAYDEATAILAGDSLLTCAFEILGSIPEMPASTRVELVVGLARSAGMGGMAGGQALDLEAERERPDEEGIVRLQAMKTGALIRFACEAGAIAAGASAADRERLAEYGSAIGLAFQLADDLLDIEGDPGSLGKATGKDAERGKATLPALHGADWARRQLAGLVVQAEELIAPYGERAALLRSAARFIAERSS